MVKNSQGHTEYLGTGWIAEPAFVEGLLGRSLKRHSHVYGVNPERRDILIGIQSRILERDQLGLPQVSGIPAALNKFLGVVITGNDLDETTVLRLNLTEENLAVINAFNELMYPVVENHALNDYSDYDISELRQDYRKLGEIVDGCDRPRRKLGVHKSELNELGQLMRKRLGYPPVSIEGSCIAPEGSHHGKER
jgi:hypothetical protein